MKTMFTLTKLRVPLFVVCLVWLCAGMPVSSADSETERDAQITDFRIAPADDQGVFKYAFKTSNGIDVQAAGSPLETIGIYSYVSPDGTPIEVRYIADELGFHVVGRHLPKPPPIPDYILRSLEYIRTHTEDGKLKSNPA